MTWRVRLERLGDPADEVTIEPDAIIEPDFQLEPTAVSSWSVEVPYTEALEDWVGSEAYVYFGDKLLARGPFVDPKSEEGNGTTVMRGRDILEYLRRPRDKRNGLVYDVTQTAAHEAIRAFYDLAWFGDDWQTTVHDPETTPQLDGETIQYADATVGDFTEIFDVPDTKPVSVYTDRVAPRQIALVAEGEAATSDTVASTEYSKGDAARLDAAGESLGYDFGFAYTVPADHVGVAVRDESASAGRPEIVVSLNGTTLATLAEGVTHDLAWRDVPTSDITSDLAASDTHTLTIEATTSGTDLAYYADVVTLYDARYTDPADWDNAVSSGGYLDDPPLYPPRGESVRVEPTPAATMWNVTWARLETSVDGGDYPRFLELSFDGAVYYKGDTTTIEEANDDTATTTVGTAVGLGADRSLDARSDTPRRNYEASDLTGWNVIVDANDLPVITNETYQGTYLDVWQDLHEDANMVGVAEYDEDYLGLESFTPGAVAGDAEWTRLDHSRERDLTDYANRVRAIGAEDYVGERIEVVATNDAEVEREGEVIEGDPVIKPDEADVDALRTAARRAVAAAVQENRMTGELEVVPTSLTPGYSYPVPAFQRDGDAEPPRVTLWSVSFSESSGRLSFGKPEDIAAALASVRSDVRRR